MACPNPQPGHHLKPKSANGHKVKWVWFVGSVSANEISAAVQKASSKYFENIPLINFIMCVGKQYRYAQGK